MSLFFPLFWAVFVLSLDKTVPPTVMLYLSVQHSVEYAKFQSKDIEGMIKIQKLENNLIAKKMHILDQNIVVPSSSKRVLYVPKYSTVFL